MAETNEQKVPENTGISRIGRDDKGRFVEGISGNPAGKPKGSISLVALLKKELEEQKIKMADGSEITLAHALIKKVLKKAIQDEDGQMARDIINRIDGMPKQAIEISEIKGMKTAEDIFEDDDNQL